MTQTIEPPDEALAAFHSTVLDAVPEAVIVATPDGRITFVNHATERMLGYSAPEIVGRPITDLVPREPGRRADPVKWLARWAAEPDVEQSRFLDLTARRKDGGELTVEVRVRQGVVEGRPRYFITVRDVTVRRQEQIALKDANLRAARILMVAPDAIVSIDAGQKIILFNPAAEEMFGYAADEVMGRDLSVLIPPEHRADHVARVAAFGRSKSASRLMSERSEVQGRRRNGEVFPLEATITRVMAAGALTYTAHLRDLTERKRAQAALEESERRIRAVFDNALEAIALLTPAGAILEINRAGEALAESGGAVVGAPLWEVPWLGANQQADPEARGVLREAIAQAAAGQPASLAAELTRDGAPLPIELRLSPIADDAGRVGYVLVEARERAAAG